MTVPDQPHLPHLPDLPDPPHPPDRTGSPAPARARAAVVRRADLGDVAWQVLLRDGDLVPLRDDTALPAGVPETATLRAAALAPRVPARCAVARAAAVWVHLGGPPPDRLHVVAPRRVRVPDPAPGRAAAVADLPDRDVMTVGGVRVTTPRRTAVDLLSHDPPELALTLVARLAAAGLDLTRLRADVAAAAGRRGIRAAAALLPRAAPAAATARPAPPAPPAPSAAPARAAPDGRQASTTGWSAFAPVIR